MRILSSFGATAAAAAESGWQFLSWEMNSIHVNTFIMRRKEKNFRPMISLIFSLVIISYDGRGAMTRREDGA